MKKITPVFLFIYLCFTCTFSSCKKNLQSPQSSIRTTPRAVSAANFKVIGYLPTWAGSVSAIQFSKLTHINYAFLIPTTSGGYEAVEDAAKLSSLVTSAHANGVKVLISVGGGGGGDAFHNIVASSSLRTTFVNNMVSFASQYNLDGVDIDWEYPSTGTEAINFLTLMTSLSTAMHNEGKLCTIAVIGDGGTSILDGIFSVVDYLQIMAYDDNNFQHSTYAIATRCMDYWLDRGVPAAKAILGVPFYARDNRYDYATKNYNELLALGASPDSDVFQTYGYNGIPTIKSKTALAMQEGGGIMAWELSGDEGTGTHSLVSAIHDVVISGNAAPIGQTITLKGFNGKYVSSKNGTAPMICNANLAQGWEQFTIVDAGGGKIALRGSNGLYVSSENGTEAINCNRTTIQGWEKFDWVGNSLGQVAFRGNNGKFISSENGTQDMTCNRDSASGWEYFGINQ
ncbi:Chitinase, GH18 family [Chitinophaga costaii]|uniref:chitinase n=1 Tax=Chitinophaga costaii TaxID=1335309 RepID=A0A1C4DTF1_9BACT|nr:glycosyl hydrolase family 18 protein [Chitinophaga costaii]PUZ27784.1 hypothetical protein DCM91_06140 [Chitinophaga costaii]SCC34676.1 Chitinase, GH18 family [Chitinophaga costaii]